VWNEYLDIDVSQHRLEIWNIGGVKNGMEAPKHMGTAQTLVALSLDCDQTTAVHINAATAGSRF
jgi:hypothetical protein